MQNTDRSLSFMLMIGLLAASLMVLIPFISSLFWAGLLAFATWPLMTRLSNLLNGRITLSAGILTLIWMMIVVIPVSLLSVNIVEHVTDAIRLFKVVVEDGLPSVPVWLIELPLVGSYIADAWLKADQESAAYVSAIKPYLGQIGNWVAARGAQVGGGVLELTLSLVLVFFFYRDGPALAHFTRGILNKLVGERADHYLDITGGTVQRVVNGVIGTAAAQAVLALIGFWIAGVPGAIILAVITFFLSFLPSAPPLVWIPVTIWLASTGAYGYATFMAIWGIFVISGVDNILKPYLISRGGKLPLVLVLIGVFGGLLAFGFMGLFIGPTLLALSYSLVDDWIGNEASV